MNSAWLRHTEVAEMMGRTPRWVCEYLIKNHRVEARKLNRKNIFVSKRSLEDYLELHTSHAYCQVRK